MSLPTSGTTIDPGGSQPHLCDPAVKEQAAAGEEKEGIDHFDRLPDSVVLAVFNLVGDVKDLGRCCVVSHRFHTLVALVDRVVVRVDCVISDDFSLSSSGVSGGREKGRGVFSHLARIVLGGLVKPFHALGQIIDPTAPLSPRPSPSPSPSAFASSSSSASSEVSHHSPVDVLKNFKEIRFLRIELPAGELGIDEGIFLKWKAEFGSSLNSCVILGASSVLSSPPSPKCDPNFEDACMDDNSGSIPESFYTNGSLKLRLFWTISSLIAASARHYLLHPIIVEHKTLERLDLADLDGQGVLTMNRTQLQEFGAKPVSTSGTSQRTLVPALSIRLWYAPLLELSHGVVMKGATLVAVLPCEEKGKEVTIGGDSRCAVGSPELCWISDAFEEPYRSAASMLLKRRTYCLEMNSF